MRTYSDAMLRDLSPRARSLIHRERGRERDREREKERETYIERKRETERGDRREKTGIKRR